MAVSDTYVLDSFAVLALLGREAGSEEVAALLRQALEGKAALLMTWVNAGEVVYIVERRAGTGRAYQALAFLEAAGVHMVAVERDLALAAAHLKAEHALAYADAFAAALAVSSDAALVTGDPEFEAVEGVLPIRWVGV